MARCDILPLWWGLQVLMKDMVTPVPPEEVKGVIRKCLEQAAQLNYQRIKDYAKIEGNQTPSLNVSQWRQDWKMYPWKMLAFP